MHTRCGGRSKNSPALLIQFMSLFSKESASERVKYVELLMTDILFASEEKRREMSRTESYLELRSAPVRGRIDIMANILNEVRLSRGGSRKTRLIYRCNLNFRQIKIYLKILLGKGFLRVVLTNGSRAEVEIYQITEEGQSFLDAYNDLSARLGEEHFTP